MNLLSKIYKRSVTVCIVVILALSAGIFFTSQMSVTLLPDISMPFLGVSIVYPGASASAVESDVTVPLEQELRKISNVNSITVTSIENASIAIINYNYGVNLKEKKEDLRERLDKISFPDSCYQPSIVEVDFNGTAVATVSVYNPTADIVSTLNDAKLLREKFTAISGVGSVTLIGAPENKVTITPINGLEMTTLLLVQSLALDSLDIPIGQLIDENGTILVRNMSSATSLEQLASKPISITLPTTTWNSMRSVKNALIWYEDSTTTELTDMKTDIDGILEFIAELESKNNTELDDINDNLSLFSSLINLVKNNSSTTLRLMWSEAISPRVSDPDFQALTDDEIEDLATDLKMSPSLLRWVRDNSIVEEGQTKSNIEMYWDEMVAFRKEQEDAGKVGEENVLTITEAEYCPLLYDMEIAQNVDETADDYYTEPELTDAITLAMAINTVGLNSVVTTLKEHNDGVTDDDGNIANVSNTQYATMFANTDFDENLPMSATTMEIIRSDNFDANWQVIYTYKQSHQHVPTQEEIDALNLEEGATPPAYVTETLTSQNLFEVYSLLTLTDELPITLTLDLTDFVWSTDFDNLVYASDSQSTLNTSIGKIAKIERTADYESVAYQNNFASLILEVYTVSGANQTSVCRQVKEIIASQTTNSTVLLLDDQSEFITDSISNVVSSMIIGGVLAVIVILLFLKDFRTSIIIAVTMPLSVLCALMCLYFMGISLNMVSLGGLAIGIGMLVDNSIVVIESIALERDKGKTAHEAAVDGTRIVMSPLIASTLTSICVFFPILFTNGLTKEIFTDLSWSVIYSLSFSLVVAITVIPTLYCLVFGKNRLLTGKVFGKKRKNRKENNSQNTKQPDELTPLACSDNVTAPSETCPENTTTANAAAPTPKIIKQDALTKGITKLLDKILPTLLNVRWLVVLIAFLLFGASIVLAFTTGTEFLPPADKGIIEVNIGFSPSQDIYDCQTQTLIAKNEIAQTIEGIDYLSTQCAKSGIIATSITGTITVQLDKTGKTSAVVEQIRSLLADNGYSSVSVTEIDGVVAVMTSGMAGLSVSIQGSDTAVLREITAEITEKLMKIDFIRHVQSSLTDQTTEYVLNVDRSKCVDNGIDYTVLIQTLYVGVSGISPGGITIDDETMNIRVMFTPQTLADYYGGLNKFIVGFDSEGEEIRLEDIALITQSSQSTAIARQDGQYTATLSVETYGVDTGRASEQILKTAQGVLSQEKYSGYVSTESGVNSYLTDAFAGLVVALVVSFVLLFAVMACQFESLSKPFIVIFSIPFAFTGGFLALAISGTALSVVSFIGIIMLMGVVVNNAIILIERIGDFEKEGMDAKLAIIEGTKSRVRPILMTTLTTVMALVPLALGIGKGSELMQPLGIVVLGGLTLGTLVTLVLIPIIYALVKRVKPRKKQKEKVEVIQE